MSRLALTPDQQAEADRLTQLLTNAAAQEIREIAELLASKPDNQFLGKTEFQVRDLAHRIGAKALETALSDRKKGATKDPA